jgi:hypothetical protein
MHAIDGLWDVRFERLQTNSSPSGHFAYGW